MESLPNARTTIIVTSNDDERLVERLRDKGNTYEDDVLFIEAKHQTLVSVEPRVAITRTTPSTTTKTPYHENASPAPAKTTTVREVIKKTRTVCKWVIILHPSPVLRVAKRYFRKEICKEIISKRSAKQRLSANQSRGTSRFDVREATHRAQALETVIMEGSRRIRNGSLKRVTWATILANAPL